MRLLRLLLIGLFTAFMVGVGLVITRLAARRAASALRRSQARRAAELRRDSVPGRGAVIDITATEVREPTNAP